jgi:hypothetical protein
VCDGLAAINGASSAENEARWVEAAQDWMRHLIQKVPGSGAVRGVLDLWRHALRRPRQRGGDQGPDVQGDRCRVGRAGLRAAAALQDRAGRAECRPRGPRATRSSARPPAPRPSSAHRRPHRHLGRGHRDADKAAGYLIVANQTGQFKAGEALKSAPRGGDRRHRRQRGDRAPPGGRYAFKVKNFYGATNLRRIYGVNGVGTGFEYDGGNVLTPIETGMPEGKDKPDHIFDIANASRLHLPGRLDPVRAPGEPCIFNAILGAAEIGMGDDITDVIDSTDDAVIFFAKARSRP